MKYYVVEITNSKNEREEILNLAMSRFESLGQSYFNLEEARVDEILGERAFSGGEIPLDIIEEVEAVSNDQPIEFYFSKPEQAASFVKEIAENYADIGINQRCEEERDWNEVWRKHYSKIEVEDILTIYPQWDAKEIGEKEIKVYPGQGFGTGEHETTWLCIKNLGELIAKGFVPAQCLDFGCGSGILGIAATRLTNCKTDYCDIDRNALDNCLSNIALNFSDQDFRGTRLVARDRFVLEKKYDLVFANILLNILIDEKDLIEQATRKGGRVIISGILNDQKKELLDRFSNQFKMIYESSKNDWSALTFERI